MGRVYLIIFSFIFSFGNVVGYNCYKYDEANLNNIKTYLCIFILSFITYIVIYFLKKIRLKDNKSKIIDKIFDSKLILFIIIFLSCLIAFIKLFPGNFAYDVLTQLNMITGKGAFTKYQPVMHTLFIGLTIYLGKIIFHKYAYGLMIYSILQSAILSYILAYTLNFLYKRKFNKNILILMLLFYILMPTFKVLSVTTTKDVIFSVLFNLVVIYLIKLLSDRNNLDSKKFILLFTLFTFLSLTFRNNMLYAYIIFIPFLLLCFKKYRKKVLIISSLPIILYILYDSTLTHVFKINHGPRVEAFSFVVQQYARVYHKDKMDNNDRKMVHDLFKDNSIDRYNSHISDPIKEKFDSDRFFQNKNLYIKIYFKYLFKYPKTYIDSILINSYGNYYILDKMPDKGSRTYIGINCLKEKGNNYYKSLHCKDRNSKFSYFKLLHNGEYSESIILRILFNPGIYLYIFIYIFIYTFIYNIHMKRRKNLCILTLILLYTLTIFIAPVSLVRYMFYLYTLLPLIIYLKDVEVKNEK